ncbi:MAG: hypothetical protein AAF492_16155, partial [Verrucomicrobiota bacterium]
GLDLEEGIYTVAVTAAAGYLPSQSRCLPNQVANPTSEVGNPRIVNVGQLGAAAAFSFESYGTTRARVRDTVTGSWLDGVKISFAGAEGHLVGQEFGGYPAAAVYRTNWFTTAAGEFPANLQFPASETVFDLTLTHTNYETLFLPSVVSNLSSNVVANLGMFQMMPMDTNGNEIADTWEEQYFGPGAGIDPGHDADADGFDNLQEYLLGTDPTDMDSVLRLLGRRTAANDGFVITWPVAPGRVYAVEQAEDLIRSLWYPVGGPWTARFDEVQMEWTETNLPHLNNGAYRIRSF